MTGRVASGAYILPMETPAPSSPSSPVAPSTEELAALESELADLESELAASEAEGSDG